MKTTMQKISYLFLSLIIVMMAACKGDVGPAGSDGTDGANGADGTNGNANAQTFLFSAPEWTNHIMALNISEITNDVLQNDVILGYVDLGDQWFSTDALLQSGGSLRSTIAVGKYSIYAYDENGVADADPPSVTSAKILIIESSNTTTIATGNGRMSVSPQQAIFNELENAGVNINNYEEVAAYYNIKN